MNEQLKKFLEEQATWHHSEFVPEGHRCLCAMCHQKDAYNLHLGVLSGEIELEDNDVREKRTVLEKEVNNKARQRGYMRKYMKKRYKEDPVYREAMKAKSNAHYKKLKEYNNSGALLTAESVIEDDNQEIDNEVARQKEVVRNELKEKYAKINANTNAK